jgi:hypothetical protein
MRDIVIAEETEVTKDLKVVILGMDRNLIIIHVLFITVHNVIIVIAPSSLLVIALSNLYFHENFHKLSETILMRLAFHSVFVY